MPGDRAALSGGELRALLASGCRTLKKNSAAVDALNVFPVPDGDTGRNMSRTLAGAVEHAPEQDAVGAYLRGFSRHALLSARGNSGVILSQFIRGCAAALENAERLTLADASRAFSEGARMAYQAVMEPVEGTMLTLLREGAAHLAGLREETFAGALQSLLEQQRRVLRKTPDMLPVLKEAHVVDSGGAGLVYILEGMLAGLTGKSIGEAEPADEAPERTPLPAMEEEASKEYAVVACASGEGLRALLGENGADAVIDLGGALKPSAEDFLYAFSRLKAAHIIVLPDDPDVILSAHQAAQLYNGADVRVLDARSVAEGYAALSIMNPEAETIEALLEDMKEALSGVVTGYVTQAVRDSALQGLAIRPGDWLGIVDKRILAVRDTPQAAALAMLEALEDISQKQVITVFCGQGAEDEASSAIAGGITTRWSHIEAGCAPGGQAVYRYILAIE